MQKVTDPAILAQLNGGGSPAPAQQPAPRGPVFGPAPAPPKPERAPSGYRYDGNGALVPIPGGPADPRAEPDKAPSGYRYTADGNLEAIPGGPATRSREGGAIPVSATGTVRDGISAFTALRRARENFKDDFVGNLAGGMENTLQAYTPEAFGTVGTPGQSDWWADFRRTDNLERNQLFGATLTPGEKTAYAQTTITPGMNAREARANLERREEIIRTALEREKEFFLANGYKPEAVEALFSPLAPRAVDAANAGGEGNGEDNEYKARLISAYEGGATYEELDAIAAEYGLALSNVSSQEDLDRKRRAGVGFTFGGGETPPASAAPAQSGGAVESIGTSLGNTLIGYAQGAGEAAIDFPLTIGAAPQVAMNSLIGGARAMYNDATGDTANAARIRAQTEQDNQRTWNAATPVANVFNSLLPAPQGYQTQRDVARFAGGFLVPGPKGAKPAPRAPAAVAAPRAASGVIDNAAEVIAEGQRRNVPVMTTDIKPPQSGMGRFVKQTLPEKIPFAGTSGPRANQQAARVEAVNEVVEEFGGSTGRELFDSAPNAAEDIARALGDERTRRIGNFKQAKDGVIDSVQQPFNAAPKTVQAISEQVRKLQEIDPEEFAPVIERLQRFGERLTSGASLRTVEEQRKLLGELFTDPNLARIKTQGQKALNAIYDPLRQDMGDFIEATAGRGARVKWQRANEGLSAMAGELKSARFRNVLRDADVTPEAVNRILFADMNNVTDMQRLVGNLPAQGKAKVKTALIQRAFDDANGPEGVSVERFVGNIERLSGKIGVAFDGNEKRSIEGLRRLMNATRRGAAAGANIRTGEQNLPTVLGIGATQVAGVTGGVGTLGVGGLLARLYESPAMRDRFVKLAATKQGSPQEARALELIMRGAVPTINQWRATLPNALNDNPAARLAAEEQQPSEPN